MDEKIETVIPTIVVVNKRKHLPLPPNGTKRIYVGRPSPLGNPFQITHQSVTTSRIRAVKKYEEWIRLGEDPMAKEAYAEIGHLVELVIDGYNLELECWCAPLLCHADVIRQLILEDEWLMK